MPNPYFRFRHFTIYQQDVAMKVSTDACLFGALVARDLHMLLPQGADDVRVLDIGSGTGLLTLMVAQQHGFNFEAIEIEPAAFRQGKANMEASPWAKKIRCHHQDLRSFQPDHPFRIMVCNPPFFSRQLNAPDARRNMARHDATLGLDALLDFAGRYLDEDGLLFLLMPAAREAEVRLEAGKRGLSLRKQISISHSPAHPVTRNCWIWSKRNCSETFEQLNIYEDDGQPSVAFSGLLHEYYLHAGT